MLEIPEKLKPLVSDYKMNLIQLRISESLHFHNEDVYTVFAVCRSIYRRNYDKIRTVYAEQVIPAELGVVIGAITESQKLIDHALEVEQKGGSVNMCTALEELKKEGIREGIQEGEIKGSIRTCKRFHISQEDTIDNIMKEFSLPEEEALKYIKKYW